MFSDVWVDLIRQAHADVPETEAVVFTRADGATVWVTYLAVDFPAPDFQARRLVVGGTTADGEPSRDVFTQGAGDFPPELAPLIRGLAEAQRECPWEL
jgi:hypothetical protein